MGKFSEGLHKQFKPPAGSPNAQEFRKFLLSKNLIARSSHD